MAAAGQQLWGQPHAHARPRGCCNSRHPVAPPAALGTQLGHACACRGRWGMPRELAGWRGCWLQGCAAALRVLDPHHHLHPDPCQADVPNHHTWRGGRRAATALCRAGCPHGVMGRAAPNALSHVVLTRGVTSACHALAAVHGCGRGRDHALRRRGGAPAVRVDVRYARRAAAAAAAGGLLGVPLQPGRRLQGGCVVARGPCMRCQPRGPAVPCAMAALISAACCSRDGSDLSRVHPARPEVPAQGPHRVSTCLGRGSKRAAASQRRRCPLPPCANSLAPGLMHVLPDSVARCGTHWPRGGAGQYQDAA